MTSYKNLSGQSNVLSYSYTQDSFTVLFKDGMHYLYSTLKNPQSTVDKMKELADRGIGLNSMLATKPHCPHDRKW